MNLSLRMKNETTKCTYREDLRRNTTNSQIYENVEGLLQLEWQIELYVALPDPDNKLVYSRVIRYVWHR